MSKLAIIVSPVDPGDRLARIANCFSIIRFNFIPSFLEFESGMDRPGKCVSGLALMGVAIR